MDGWIPILVAECLSPYAFFQVFVEIIKFEGYSHGLFNFSKKDSASRHALNTKRL